MKNCNLYADGVGAIADIARHHLPGLKKLDISMNFFRTPATLQLIALVC